MKRFVAFMLLAGVLLLGGYYLYFYQGFYFPGETVKEPEIPFRAEGRKIQRKIQEQEYEVFEIRGVEVLSSLPGHSSSEFAPEEEDYRRWFAQIHELGANTVRAANVMDADFYNALFSYNQSADEPLFLLQGITVSDKVNNGAENAYDGKLLEMLIEDGKKAVDIIHGRKSILIGRRGESGRYRKDISQWVIGLVVGNTWSADTIAYTDHSSLHQGGYQGTYFSSASEAGAFETMLAQIMDKIASYEMEKYGEQRPIGFANSPEHDFLRYQEEYALQLKKYSYLDAEHILAGTEWKAGTFAAYRLFDYCDGFSGYLEPEQNEDLAGILDTLDKESSYGGYLELLANYHSMPVLALGYGCSTARGAVSQDNAPITEEEQGERLMEVYRDAKRFGWSGVCISSWQDRWEQKSWNTAYAVNSENRVYWHDLQTEGASYGLLAFSPGESEQTVRIDGIKEEWEETELVLTQEGMKLYAKYDFESLYLCVEGGEVSPDNPIYIPIDTLKGNGSMTVDGTSLELEREADFLLCIDGTENTRLLVQERYDALREKFAFEMTGENPFVYYPEKGSSLFNVVRLALENDSLIEHYTELTPQERRQQTAPIAFETGRLICGNGNANSRDYNSLADFSFGEGIVELRIPWLLLNVGDASAMLNHEDYYVNYGVEFQKLKTLYLGLTTGKNGTMASFKVEGSGKKPIYFERLKKSFQIIQKEWKGRL